VPAVPLLLQQLLVLQKSGQLLLWVGLLRLLVLAR
jgi:hypothetical protein